ERRQRVAARRPDARDGDGRGDQPAAYVDGYALRRALLPAHAAPPPRRYPHGLRPALAEPQQAGHRARRTDEERPAERRDQHASPAHRPERPAPTVLSPARGNPASGT